MHLVINYDVKQLEFVKQKALDCIAVIIILS